MPVTGVRHGPLTRINHDQRKNYDTASIEGEPSGAKAIGLCLGVACNLSLWRTPGKMRVASQAP